MQTQNTITTMANTNNGKAAKTTTNPASQISNYVTLLLDREARQLAKMRARGKKNAQIIDWLRNRGVNATSTELDAYWQHLAEQQAMHKQQWIQERRQRPPASARSLLTDDSNNSPDPSSERLRTSQNDEEALSPGDADCGPAPRSVAHGGLYNGQCGVAPSGNAGAARTLAAAPSTEEIMLKYRRLLVKMLDEGDTTPANMKVINQMIRNVASYERSQVRAKERAQAAKDKEINRQIKVSSLALDQAAKDLATRIQAKPLTRTEKIAEFRKKYFRSADEPVKTVESKPTTPNAKAGFPAKADAASALAPNSSPNPTSNTQPEQFAQLEVADRPPFCNPT